jgi:pimeloyl-ACP methyl ester carboxylesterase
MTHFLKALFLAGTVVVGASAMAIRQTSASTAQPTIVLVHGAFADASSWNGVISGLQKQGYTVIATANPSRSLKGDSGQVASVLKEIKGPVVLVGHSYGGAVITNAATGNSNVKALVYVAGFAPDLNETAVELSSRFPGSTLGGTLAPPVALLDGNVDLYIQQSKFHSQFAADLGQQEAQLMAATQRPVTSAALNEKSAAPAWKTIPSWFIFGTLDKNIPLAALEFMAKRADSKEAVVIEGASYVVMVSNPNAVVKLIEDAANAK